MGGILEVRSFMDPSAKRLWERSGAGGRDLLARWEAIPTVLWRFRLVGVSFFLSRADDADVVKRVKGVWKGCWDMLPVRDESSGWNVGML
jgi:hypothetical protein